jgi:hypothetical protein
VSPRLVGPEDTVEGPVLTDQNDHMLDRSCRVAIVAMVMMIAVVMVVVTRKRVVGLSRSGVETGGQ